MELPIEKQFQIMDLLRNRVSIRDIAELLHVAKSTVQDYKKHGPPYYRKYAKNSSVEPYPVSLQEENAMLRKAFERLYQLAQQTIDLHTAANKETYHLRWSNTQKNSEIEGHKQEKEQLKKQVSERDEQIHTLTSEKDRLNNENSKLKSEDMRKTQSLQDVQRDLQKCQTKLTDATTSLKSKEDTITEIIAEQDKYKEETRRLKLKQRNAKFIHAAFGITGFGLGILTDRLLLGLPLNIPIFGYRNGQNTYKICQTISTSSTPSSGEISNHYTNNTTHGFNAPANQQENKPQPVILVGDNLKIPTIIPGLSGIDSNHYQGNTTSGYTIMPPNLDINQPDTHNEVTTITNTQIIQGSGYYNSSHYSGAFDLTLHNIPPVYKPSISQIPTNYYHYLPLPSPLPDDLSEIYIMRQLRSLKGISFEKYIKKFLDHRGCPMELTPYRDKGVDLFGQMDGKKTIIQCKQKPKVEIGVIQRLYANKKRYKADRFLVITTGEFTKDAIEEARNLGVECWDGKKLLEEIYKDQFFYQPE